MSINLYFFVQTVIEFTGGWNISGKYNDTMDFKERLYR